MVELEFGEEVGAGDTEEGAGAEGESVSEPGGVLLGDRGCAEVEEECSQRGDEGEGEACVVAPSGGEILGGHESGDGEGSERFMEDHGERGAEAEDAGAMAMGIGGDGGGHGESIEH